MPDVRSIAYMYLQLWRLLCFNTKMVNSHSNRATYLGQLLFRDNAVPFSSLLCLVNRLNARVSGLSSGFVFALSSICDLAPVRLTLVLSYRDPARLSLWKYGELWVFGLWISINFSQQCFQTTEINWIIVSNWRTWAVYELSSLRQCNLFFNN